MTELWGAVAGWIVWLTIILFLFAVRRSTRKPATPPPVLTRHEPWRRAAEDLGLQFYVVAEPGSDVGQQPVIAGRLEGLQVGVQGGAFSVCAEGAIRYDLVLQARRRRGGLATGDAGFDQAVRAAGDLVSTAALLDAENRRVVRGWIEVRGADVHHGTVWLRGQEVGDAAAITATLGALVTFARRLCVDPAGVEERLRHSATRDPEIGVRRRCLAFLQQRYPHGPKAIGASREALGSADPRLRLQGALHLGAEGAAVAGALALAEDLDEESRLLAIGHLVHHLGAEAAVPLLRLLDSPARLRLAAVAGLGTMRAAAGVPPLVRLLASELDPETLAAAVASLGRIGDAAAEPALLRLLESRGWGVRAAAARALGGCGTAAAVEPLLAHSRGVTIGGEVKRAAREAVAAIQSRLVGAEAGRLSVVAPRSSEGRLSVAERGGWLSEAAAPAEERPADGAE